MSIVDGFVTSAAGNTDVIAQLFPSLFGQPSAVLQPCESNDPASTLKTEWVCLEDKLLKDTMLFLGCLITCRNGAREVLYMDSRVDQLGS
nr:pyrophosphate--fructose 6-phosphate 1-phosphotransferase subunit beta-like [Tanacetum cinerariifolium]